MEKIEQTKGAYTAKDKYGAPVIIEWQKTGLLAPEFAAIQREAWEVAQHAFLPVEMGFLRAHPEVVGADPYFKPFEPLFANGPDAVDWDQAADIMREMLRPLYIFDASKMDPAIAAMFGKDIFYQIVVRDGATKRMLGYITFMVRADYAPGELKATDFAVDVADQNRGLGKLLMSAIFKIRPDISRIFACTRMTNRVVRLSYRACGFTEDTNPLMDYMYDPKYWVFMEYRADRANILQKKAAEIV